MLKGITTRSPGAMCVDLGADLLDHAHRLVAEDVAGVDERAEDLVEVQVRAADAGRGDADDRVGRLLDRRVVDGVDADVVRSVPGHCLHRQVLLPTPVRNSRIRSGAAGAGAQRRRVHAGRLLHPGEQLLERGRRAEAGVPTELLARAAGVHQRDAEPHVEPARRGGLQMGAPGGVGEDAQRRRRDADGRARGTAARAWPDRAPDRRRCCRRRSRPATAQRAGRPRRRRRRAPPAARAGRQRQHRDQAGAQQAGGDAAGRRTGGAPRVRPRA